MYRWRASYWSNSDFARWLTKRALAVDTPRALSMEDWRSWDELFKELAPVTYFFVEEVFDRVQNVVMFPVDVYRNARAYARNRWGDQVHVLKAGKPGEYRDVDFRIMHGCFGALKDFVEIEKALSLRWNGEEFQKLKHTFKRDTWWNILQTERSPEAGLAYLDWEMSLKERGRRTHQAKVAAEIKQLYWWWVHDRPARQDPYDLVTPSLDTEPSDKQAQLIKSAQDMEAEYRKQDTDMLIRLIKIRESLWT